MVISITLVLFDIQKWAFFFTCASAALINAKLRHFIRAKTAKEALMDDESVLEILHHMCVWPNGVHMLLEQRLNII